MVRQLARSVKRKFLLMKTTSGKDILQLLPCIVALYHVLPLIRSCWGGGGGIFLEEMMFILKQEIG